MTKALQRINQSNLDTEGTYTQLRLEKSMPKVFEQQNEQVSFQ